MVHLYEHCKKAHNQIQTYTDYYDNLLGSTAIGGSRIYKLAVVHIKKQDGEGSVHSSQDYRR